MEIPVKHETAQPETSLTDAARLERHGQPCHEVISVDRDSILYLTRTLETRTMWVFRPPGRAQLLVQVVAGFQAEPPIEWLERVLEATSP